jgi:hypothetical protein
MIPFYFLEKEITDLKVGHFIINNTITDCEAPCSFPHRRRKCISGMGKRVCTQLLTVI